MPFGSVSITEIDEAFEAFKSLFPDEDFDRSEFDDFYFGRAESRLDFAKDLLEDFVQARSGKVTVPYLDCPLSTYVDWTKITRHLFKEEFYAVPLPGGGGIYVLRRDRMTFTP